MLLLHIRYAHDYSSLFENCSAQIYYFKDYNKQYHIENDIGVVQK